MPTNAENTILALPKVKACRIFFENDEVEQIFVSADIDAAAESKERLQMIKSLVRSIIGALALEHDWDVDYRKVKIVDSLEVRADPENLFDQRGRIRILAAYVRYLPQPEVLVELGLDNSIYKGQAVYDNAQPLQSAVNAFLKAFHSMNLGKANLLFANQLPESLSHGPVVVVKFRLIDTHSQSTELWGIAESKQDLMLCAVRACLSALNRKIGLTRH
ncbi:MAG: hypothetical protein GX316_07835 [Firmicutes bacterium]|nr:hypothetical protein [Bacillota bacterium]